MVISRIIIVLLLIMQLRRIKSEPDSPNLRVKLGNVQRGVNNSAFDLSENHVVVDHGHTVQFICEGNYDLEWTYKDLDTSERYNKPSYKHLLLS